jgi:hypothetical protein
MRLLRRTMDDDSTLSAGARLRMPGARVDGFVDIIPESSRTGQSGATDLKSRR